MSGRRPPTDEARREEAEAEAVEMNDELTDDEAGGVGARRRCLPAPPDASMCSVEVLGPLVAGAGYAAALRVVLRDGGGNAATASGEANRHHAPPSHGGDVRGGFVVAVTCDGPGVMSATAEAEAEEVAVKCAATAAGQYSVAVVDARTKVREHFNPSETKGPDWTELKP